MPTAKRKPAAAPPAEPDVDVLPAVDEPDTAIPPAVSGYVPLARTPHPWIKHRP